MLYLSEIYKTKRTCVLAVLQAGMMALETLAFSATFPGLQLNNIQPKIKKGYLTSSYKIAKDTITICQR